MQVGPAGVTVTSRSRPEVTSRLVEIRKSRVRCKAQPHSVTERCRARRRATGPGPDSRQAASHAASLSDSARAGSLRARATVAEAKSLSESESPTPAESSRCPASCQCLGPASSCQCLGRNAGHVGLGRRLSQTRTPGQLALDHSHWIRGSVFQARASQSHCIYIGPTGLRVNI